MKHDKLNERYRYLPNCITALRIFGTAALLFVRPMTTPFYILYTLTGISDAADGWLARRLHASTELGARLDSVADLLFYAVMLLKIFPVLLDTLHPAVWAAAGLVLLIRIAGYLTAAVKYRCFASLHTYLNKLTGAAVFTIPYWITLPAANLCGMAVCIIGILASAEELIIHLCSSQYCAERKTIQLCRKKPKETHHEAHSHHTDRTA